VEWLFRFAKQLPHNVKKLPGFHCECFDQRSAELMLNQPGGAAPRRCINGPIFWSEQIGLTVGDFLGAVFPTQIAPGSS
jgi:hypothetical protein